MKCKTCGKEYDIGNDHKITGFSYLHFCSDQCATDWIERVKNSNKKVAELFSVRTGYKGN